MMGSVGRQRRSAKTYMRMLTALAKAKRGSKWRALAGKVAAFRKRMILENAGSARERKKRLALLRAMPKTERELLKEAGKTKVGKESLKRFRSFWGLPTPPKIKRMCLPYFGDKKVVLVGMGWTPALFLARSPSRAAKRIVIEGKWDVATDPKGKAIFYIPKGLKKCRKSEWVKVGWVKSTHYIPPKDIEDAGSFKSYAHWRHSHFDEKGKPPEAWLDLANNVFLAVGGTFSVGKWIRR